jgi:predicted metal-dependent HD superfamily phosphohydrolase
MAGRILKLIGYKPNEVVKIQKMILSTDLESEPESHVEKILCDADLDHFGRKDFFKLDGRLREEWREKGMDVSDEVKWYKGTLEILKKHQYYTESQKKLREKEKQKNIKRLLKKLENIEKRYEAKYNPVLTFQQPQL